ncbi:MATE family efflux transporter [Permianibacter aggregans]|uniref:Multidrug-efflux transporter n=1 Tax=Permianibacter aggregans TaxID=1510150 RepID=A0A4R6UKK6_9GAMM|nr:MATE family efflux transporter [Permianibacter aggregans]QGX40262.1 MATE family efflux transporter [Permianibacter aggregans]TDQ47520.1 putative MATE family efflux protein [Permianibacter aggregans]
MLDRERSSQIMHITLPVMGGMISQNILNLVDMYMVGHVGHVAVAAVGITSYTNWMLAALFIGLSAGVQAMVARRMGEGRTDIAARPLNGALTLIVVTTIPLAILLIFLSPLIMAQLSTDPEVIAQGTPYLQARIAGIAAMAMNFSFRAYWSAIKLARFYFMTLIVMHAINIALNYVLIFGKFGIPALGTFGAGLGTTLSLYCGTAMYITYALRHTKQYGFMASLPSKETMQTIIKVSLPASAQQFFYALGFTTLFWIVGMVGTGEMAVANVLVNVTLVAYLPCLSYGISAATLVGQALGRNEPEDAYRWGWDVSKLAMLTVLLIGLPMAIFAPEIIAAFIDDALVAEMGITPLRLIAISLIFDALGVVMFHGIQGAGATRTTMLVSLGMQWLVFLPLAYLAGPVGGHGILVIWSLYIAYRFIQTMIFVFLWRQRAWTQIKLN